MPLLYYFIILVFLSVAIPCVTILLEGYFRHWKGVRLPVKERMLRPAGTSLSTQIESLEEKLSFRIFMTAIIPAGCVAMLASGIPNIPAIPTGLAIRGALVTTLLAGLSTLWMRRIVKKLRDQRLGMRGEQVVAEHLQSLERAGCHVFHDVQPEGTWNIDHIVVAPDAVLVIETKTRRKRVTANNTIAHEIVYDGKTITGPTWRDSRALDQAVRNADWLRNHLARALRDVVQVDPVVTFPGWMIRRKGRGKVCVVNPKEFGALVRQRGSRDIPPEKRQRMEQIAFAIEGMCRNVEF